MRPDCIRDVTGVVDSFVERVMRPCSRAHSTHQMQPHVFIDTVFRSVQDMYALPPQIGINNLCILGGTAEDVLTYIKEASVHTHVTPNWLE